MKHPTPQELKDRLKAITIEYDVKEWRIEKTGLLTMFTQDFELNSWLIARGVRLTPHYTGKNKHDTAFGVGSLAPLFGVYMLAEDGSHHQVVGPSIELPRHEVDIQTLVTQLQVWHPEIDPKKTAVDLVMALWFFDIGCRDYVKGSDQFQRRRKFNGLVSPRDRKRASVIDLTEFRAG